MNIQMVPVEIVALKTDLQAVLHTLRRLGCVHFDELAESPQISARPLTLDRQTLQKQEDLNFLRARLAGLLDTLGCELDSQPYTPADDSLKEAQAGLDEIMPKVQELTSRRERLLAEQASLPRYETTLRKLLPIIPPSARHPDNSSIGVLVSRAHMGVLDSVGKRVLDLTAGRGEIVASDVDVSTRAMLIVFPKEYTNQIETLLGREDVSRLSLPADLDEGPPDLILAKLHRRMAAIPEELSAIQTELDKLTREWCGRLATWRDLVRDELDANSVLTRLGETDTTFVIAGWLPEQHLTQLRESLQENIGDAFLVRALPLTTELKKRAPVIQQNPKPAQPFESLVRLLALPRYGHIDPTQLMAFFLPIFFGMILGDIGYGCILLIISLLLMRRFPPGVVRDVLIVLAMGSAWAIVFGVLYGEFFGTLGEQLGLHAIWIDRASPEDVASLLVMTLVVGAVHLTLGLILGVWEAIRDRSRNHLLERGGMLIGLISLFFIVAIVTDYLPANFMTPAIVGLILGIVLLGASLGWLGIIMGPIEFIGLIGNLLSYLRIAAIGLASVYLAKVANDIAGLAGSLIIGIILAVLIHALNLVLGAFSPTIHSLRLHYVEFFRKFYEGGGRPYKPFQSQLSTDRKK
jgi:V/A-type H+-transporting ATPase subunit I